MAGDWIKWTKGLAAKREVVLIASRLQRSQFEIAGRLMLLWEWCDDNVNEEDVDPVSLDVSLILGDRAAAFVDALCGLPGLADTLASPEIHWIEFRSGGRVVFPNLARHNGTSAKTRAYGTDKKRRQRAKACNAPDTSPNLSPKIGDKCPQEMGTREEKRREEEIQRHTSREAENAVPEAAAPYRGDPVKAIPVAKRLTEEYRSKVTSNHGTKAAESVLADMLAFGEGTEESISAAIENYAQDCVRKDIGRQFRLSMPRWLQSGEWANFVAGMPSWEPDPPKNRWAAKPKRLSLDELAGG